MLLHLLPKNGKNMFQAIRSALYKNTNIALALALFCIQVRGLCLDVMDVDAAQYASIALEMLRGGHWLQVLHRGTDYLDKPPLLFWTSAASFSLFGIHNWAYKLPSFLAALAGVWATYRFSRLFYAQATAIHAAFILASSLGICLMTNDVRTDTLLLGTTACAVWLCAEYLLFARWVYLLGAAVCVGLAMLAKGPIGLVMPLLAVGSHLLLRRDWRGLFRWQWLVGLAVVALVLAPMCWGLYQQFDLHPEKSLNDRRTTSGLYFFFWEQSFGRVTGENVWEDDSTPLFFVHTYLWVFLPWALLFAGALWTRARAVFLQKCHIATSDEAYSLGGFLLTFVALSLSKYKLPHYIYVTLPWAAVLTARFLEGLFAMSAKRSAQKYWINIQYFVLIITGILAFFAPGKVFFSTNIWIWCALLATFGCLIFVTWQNPWPSQADILIKRSVLASIGLGISLNFWFYPHLLPYQSTAAAGKWVRQQEIPAEKCAYFLRHGHALDFYAQFWWQKTTTPASVAQLANEKNGLYLYTTADGKAELDSAQVRYTTAAIFDHFQAARLNGSFLMPETRQHTLQTMFVLKIK